MYSYKVHFYEFRYLRYHVISCSWVQNQIGQLQAVSKISSRSFYIGGHKFHRRVYFLRVFLFHNFFVFFSTCVDLYLLLFWSWYFIGNFLGVIIPQCSDPPIQIWNTYWVSDCNTHCVCFGGYVQWKFTLLFLLFLIELFRWVRSCTMTAFWGWFFCCFCSSRWIFQIMIIILLRG